MIIALSDCSRGSGFFETIGRDGVPEFDCVKCPKGTYNRNPKGQGVESQKCFACPNHSFCAGGDDVVVENGYQLVRNQSQSIPKGAIKYDAFRCEAEFVCKGGQISDSVDDLCMAGRTGLLCAYCKQAKAGFVPVAPDDANSKACVVCDSPNIPLLVLMALAAILFTVYLHVSVVKSSAKVIVIFFLYFKSKESNTDLYLYALAQDFVLLWPNDFVRCAERQSQRRFSRTQFPAKCNDWRFWRNLHCAVFNAGQIHSSTDQSADISRNSLSDCSVVQVCRALARTFAIASIEQIGCDQWQ